MATTFFAISMEPLCPSRTITLGMNIYLNLAFLDWFHGPTHLNALMAFVKPTIASTVVAADSAK